MKSMSLSGKPLLTLRTPVNLAVFRAEVEPFDALRYVDLTKLAKAPRATVELGVVRTPAGTDTLVAEVRRGDIVGLGPQHCSGCSGEGKLPEKRMRDALTRVASKLGPKDGVTLPMPITTVLGPRGLRAPLRPLIINVVTQRMRSCCVSWDVKGGGFCIRCYTGGGHWSQLCVGPVVIVK
jgi:hypothetical protein